jgi:hypothetical protein
VDEELRKQRRKGVDPFDLLEGDVFTGMGRCDQLTSNQICSSTFKLTPGSTSRRS